MTSELPQELRSVVHQTVALLGDILQRELGEDKFRFIEKLRIEMASTRTDSAPAAFARLQEQLGKLRTLAPERRREIAHAFTLMLEVMNACENAYRSHRLGKKINTPSLLAHAPDSIIYVLTAHPTEARSPENIAIFHQIQNVITASLDESRPETLEKDLPHWLEVAWRVSIMRRRSPRVKDEAGHIYSLLFRDEVLAALLKKRDYPFYVRSWVGGDKDGHPGVNEKTLLESLSLSRAQLVRLVLAQLSKIRETLLLLPGGKLKAELARLQSRTKKLKFIKTGDAKVVRELRTDLILFCEKYKAQIGEAHPASPLLVEILKAFPGLTVPLELRESSDMLEKVDPRSAIYKMLQTIERISRGGNPRWYARGFIISMTMSVEHIKAAAKFQSAIFKGIPIPVIPLFENAEALKNSQEIVAAMLKVPQIGKAAKENWDNMIEMMVGYSDSAKESGALWSRWTIAKTLPLLESTCNHGGFKPVFFHGSGGSIDRGGGSIEDQTAWWPDAALKNYKVTVQGEMVERSMASPAIAERQIEKIAENVSINLGRKRGPAAPQAVQELADAAAAHYRRKITSSDFLNLVETSTPYSYLNALKIGSRPSKRAKQLTVQGLRAIPWILCWTQTRLLFPTWWGVGSAWAEANGKQKDELRKAFKNQYMFRSYIKALGFTLAKVNLNIWRTYLRESGNEKALQDFAEELDLTKAAFYEITGQKNFLWYRPWLAESVVLRSAMIHPLNLLQILAIEDRDLDLLRVTVTGISSGMLTTG